MLTLDHNSKVNPHSEDSASVCTKKNTIMSIKEQAIEAIKDATVATVASLSTICIERTIDMQCNVVSRTWRAFGNVELQFSNEDKQVIMDKVESIVRI